MAKQNKGRKFFAASATAALVASAIVPVASAAQVNDYNKISGYAKEAVQSLVDKGVIQGDTNGNFNPLNTVTRAQAAEIFTKALELEADGEVNFKDVKAGAWYYNSIAAVVANGIFEGVSATEFAPNKSLTRSEAAKVLVDAFGLEGSESLGQFADASQVKPWAKSALETAVANGIFTGSEENGKLNLKPNAAITRQDFAVVFARTLDLVAETPVDAAVKAINNTTVEVTFAEDVNVDDVKAENFKIEGLEVTNAAVKQTDKKVVVLTTAAQTADTTYTVTFNGEKIGSFKGVSAVIPTEIKTVVASQQGVIGKEVTLSAEVKVAEGQSKAGIPVTFNIVNDKSTNAKIEVEAITDEKGVATYSYTRYYNGIDDVVAYATSKSSVKDNAKVYWASSPQLTIKEDKEGKTVANGGKKSYEINGEKNSVVFVAFEENLDIKSNKIQEVQVTSAVGYIDENDNYKPYNSGKKLTPYELSTGAAQYVVVELDNKGEGSLIITGEDATVTPIVYEAESIGDLDLDELDKEQKNVKKLDVEYGRTLLQAKADTVKFEQNDKLALDVKALGTEDAAQATTLPTAGTEIDEDNDFGLGGREYEVTVRTKEGELASKGSKAYVTFEDKDIKGDIKVIIDDVVYNVTKDTVLPAITVEKDGKASFRVIGTGKDSYATPTVFLNTEGSTTDVKLDKKDVQVKAETTYFTKADVKEAVIKVLDANDKEVTSLQAGKQAFAVYQSVDQNGFAYGTGKEYDVTFELSTTFGELKVKGGKHNAGRTYTYETTSNKDGRAVVEFTADSATTVEIDILGSRNVLPTKVATMKFTQYATGETTGEITATNVDEDTLTVGTNVYSYADAKEYKQNGSKITKAEFEKLIVKANARVSITKDADGKLTFDVLNPANPAETPVTVTSAQAVDTDRDGNVDEVVVTFSKAVDEAKLATADFTITGATVALGTDANSKDNKVTLDITGVTGLSVNDLVVKAKAAVAVDTADLAAGTIKVKDATAQSKFVGNLVTTQTTGGTDGDAAIKQELTLTVGASPDTTTDNGTVTVAGKDFSKNFNFKAVASDSAAQTAEKIYNAVKDDATVKAYYDVTYTTGDSAVKFTNKVAGAGDASDKVTVANAYTTAFTTTPTVTGVDATAETFVIDGFTTSGTVTAGVLEATISKGGKELVTVTADIAAGVTGADATAELFAALRANETVKANYNVSFNGTDITLTNKVTGEVAGTNNETSVTIQPN